MLNPVRMIFAAALLMVPLVITSPSSAEEPVKTNLDVMDALTERALTELLAGLKPVVQLGEVTLVPYASDERYEFIDNVFQRYLSSNGYITHLSDYAERGKQSNPTDAEVKGFVIEYQALDFDLRYPKIYRSYLLGGKKVKRRADIRLTARVVDPRDASVKWVGQAQQSYEDQFSYGQIDEVEKGVFSFSKPPRQSTPWGKFVEPVVVSGIIVGLIYLFFSNQTE